MKRVAGSALYRLVLRAIEIYNRYRSPEATARLLKLEKDGFTIEFEGSFCQSCGVQDYFEDFIYEFQDLSSAFELELGEIEHTNPQSFSVQYMVKSGFSGGELEKETRFQEFLQERGLSVKDYTSSNPCTRDVIRFHFRTWLFDRKSNGEAPSEF